MGINKQTEKYLRCILKWYKLLRAQALKFYKTLQRLLNKFENGDPNTIAARQELTDINGLTDQYLKIIIALLEKKCDNRHVIIKDNENNTYEVIFCDNNLVLDNVMIKKVQLLGGSNVTQSIGNINNRINYITIRNPLAPPTYQQITNQLLANLKAMFEVISLLNRNIRALKKTHLSKCEKESSDCLSN